MMVKKMEVKSENLQLELTQGNLVTSCREPDLNHAQMDELGTKTFPDVAHPMGKIHFEKNVRSLHQPREFSSRYFGEESSIFSLSGSSPEEPLILEKDIALRELEHVSVDSESMSENREVYPVQFKKIGEVNMLTDSTDKVNQGETNLTSLSTLEESESLQSKSSKPKPRAKLSTVNRSNSKKSKTSTLVSSFSKAKKTKVKNVKGNRVTAKHTGIDSDNDVFKQIKPCFVLLERNVDINLTKPNKEVDFTGNSINEKANKESGKEDVTSLTAFQKKKGQKVRKKMGIEAVFDSSQDVQVLNNQSKDESIPKGDAKLYFSCSHCRKKFRKEITLVRHKKQIHSIDKPFKCQYDGCQFATRCKGDLKKHQSKHATEKKHSCHLCGWKTKWQRNVQIHFLMKHTDERKYKCDLCSFTAKRNYDLRMHKYRHSDEKLIGCTVCGFKVKTNWELKSHLLTHSSEKPFTCTVEGCSAATKTRADLSKHMRVHAVERKYKCTLCKSAFKSQMCLNKHNSYMHLKHEAVKCGECGKLFKNKYSLRKHATLHTGTKPFKCDICDMRFVSKSNKALHMVTHDKQQRPFSCPLCPYAGKEEQFLLAHIGTMHGKSYTYFCELCRKPFRRYGCLQIHYRRMHKEEDIMSLNNPDIDLDTFKIEIDTDMTEHEFDHSDATEGMKTTPPGQVKEEPGAGELSRSFKGIVSNNQENGEGAEKCVSEKVQAGFWNTQQQNDDADGLAEVSAEVCGVTSNGINNNKTGQDTHLAIETAVTVKKELDETVQDNFSNDSAKNDNTAIRNTELLANDSPSLKEEAIENEFNRSMNATATIGLYGNLRLPLATKGFQFNYEKNGKKPKAWFMEMSCMDEQSAEKMQKYLRRKGLLPPLPKGKKKKRTIPLQTKKQSEQVKLNKKRKARFVGNYAKFETLADDGVEANNQSYGSVPVEMSLSENDVIESQMLTESNEKKAGMKTVKRKLSSVKRPFRQAKKKNANRKGSIKGSSKLLLSTEKRTRYAKSKKPLQIRKPNFLQKEESMCTTIDRIENKLQPCDTNPKHMGEFLVTDDEIQRSPREEVNENPSNTSMSEHITMSCIHQTVTSESDFSAREQMIQSICSSLSAIKQENDSREEEGPVKARRLNASKKSRKTGKSLKNSRKKKTAKTVASNPEERNMINQKETPARQKSKSKRKLDGPQELKCEKIQVIAEVHNPDIPGRMVKQEQSEKQEFCGKGRIVFKEMDWAIEMADV